MAKKKTGFIGLFALCFLVNASLAVNEKSETKVFYSEKEKIVNSSSVKITFELPDSYLKLKFKAGKEHKANCHLHLGIENKKHKNRSKDGFVGYLYKSGLTDKHVVKEADLEANGLVEFGASDESDWIDLSKFTVKGKNHLIITAYHYAPYDDKDKKPAFKKGDHIEGVKFMMDLQLEGKKGAKKISLATKNVRMVKP